MRIAAIALGAVLLAIGSAQPSLAQQDQFRPGNEDHFQSGQDDSAQRSARGDSDDWASRRQRMHAWHMRGEMGQMWRQRFAHEGGAHFRLRRGQAFLDVKCPENDSLQSCVNAISQLLDKVRTMPGPSNNSSHPLTAQAAFWKIRANRLWIKINSLLPTSRSATRMGCGLSMHDRAPGEPPFRSSPGASTLRQVCQLKAQLAGGIRHLEAHPTGPHVAPD